MYAVALSATAKHFRLSCVVAVALSSGRLSLSIVFCMHYIFDLGVPHAASDDIDAKIPSAAKFGEPQNIIVSVRYGGIRSDKNQRTSGGEAITATEKCHERTYVAF